MPRMLRDIIAGILEPEPDLELAGEIGGFDECIALAAHNPPDFVITGEDGHGGRFAERLLERHPSMRVLEVAGNGRSAYLYELRPSREFVGDISPESLLAAVRGGTSVRGGT